MSIDKKKLAYNELLGENLQYIPHDNFSFKEVPAGKKVDIFAHQQMIVEGEIVIGGELNVQGELVMLGSPLEECRYGQDFIAVDDRLVIPKHRQHIITQEMVVEGELVIEGQLVILP